MRKRSHVNDEEAEVNMTPMLDIVFIMLIFFIVTATFVRETGFDVSRPDPNEQDQPTKSARPILIQINAQNEIFLDRRRVDVRSVQANVQKRLAEDPNTAAIIQTARKANTGTMAQVMDQVRLAGAGLSLAPLAEDAEQ